MRSDPQKGPKTETTRRRGIWISLTFCLMSQALVGCAQFMSSLRQDLDDRETYDDTPTIGGNWTERGYLSESEDSARGSGRRGIASLRGAGESGRRSWTNAQAELRRRGAAFEGSEEAEGGDIENSSNARPPTVRTMYKYGNRATREDFIDEAPNEGSLWASDGQTNYYFTKNKIRGEGDIVTITMEDGLVKDTTRELVRTLTPQEREKELELAQERLTARYMAQKDRAKAGLPPNDSVGTSAAAAGRTPATTADGKKAETEENYTLFTATSEEPKATLADIDVTKSLDLRAGETMMGEIVERYPNGNYKIHATKKMGYRQGDRRMDLVAIVKGSDITEQDTLTSGKFYEYRVEVVR